NRWRSAAGICTRTVTRENKSKREDDREIILGSGSVIGTCVRVVIVVVAGALAEAGCERKCREQPAIYGRIADCTHSDHSCVGRREKRTRVLLKKERELSRVAAMRGTCRGNARCVLRLVDRKAEVHGSRARARRLRWDRERRERERASVRGTGWQAERGGEGGPRGRERERERTEGKRERKREMEMTGRLTACAITRFELAKEKLVVRLFIPPLLLAYSADRDFSDRGATRSAYIRSGGIDVAYARSFAPIDTRLPYLTPVDGARFTIDMPEIQIPHQERGVEKHIGARHAICGLRFYSQSITFASASPSRAAESRNHVNDSDASPRQGRKGWRCVLPAIFPRLPRHHQRILLLHGGCLFVVPVSPSDRLFSGAIGKRTKEKIGFTWCGGNSTLRRRERRVPRTTRGIFTRLVEAFIDARGNSYELLQSAGIKSTEVTSNVARTQEEWRGLAKRSHSQLSQLVDLSRHSSAKGSRRFPRDNNGREQRKKWAA
ncbi:hypothetical protein ALC56_03319, partial [Trachymyrmex septentrionalis]